MRDKNRAYGNQPDWKEVQAFLQGKLSPEKAAKLQQQLDEDPLWSDALEGLKWVDKPAKIPTYVSRINKVNRQRLERRKHPVTLTSKRSFRVQPNPYFKPFAATLAGIAMIGIVVFMLIWSYQGESNLNNQDTQFLSDASTSETPGIPDPNFIIPQQDSIGALNESPDPATLLVEQDLMPTTTQRASRSSRSGSHKKAELPLLTLAIDTPEEELILASVSFESPPLPLSSYPLIQGKFYEKEEEVFAFSDREVKGIPQKTRSKKIRAQRPAAMALQETPSGVASSILPTPISIPSESYQRVFRVNLGVWYFTHKMWEESQEELFQVLRANKIEGNTSSWSYYTSSWYLAKIYLEKGEHHQARNLLSDLIRDPNPYQEAAQRLLQNLD